MVPYKDLNLTKSDLFTYVQKSADFVNGKADPAKLLGQFVLELLTPMGNVIQGDRDSALKSANEYCQKYNVHNTSFYIVYFDGEANCVVELLTVN